MEQPNNFAVIAKKAWPMIYRIINGIFYFTITMIKNIVVRSLQQLKGGM